MRISLSAPSSPTSTPARAAFDPTSTTCRRFSDPGTGAGNRNVHNDACFLDDRGNKVDGPASFEVEGVGSISACPDPDGAGPKVAILSADKKLCFRSGYQQKGIAGDLEFHARLNNEGQAGTQYVTWCSDSDRDGCDDERNKDSIRIDWTRTAPPRTTTTTATRTPTPGDSPDRGSCVPTGSRPVGTPAP